jgi:hypothetical protein
VIIEYHLMISMIERHLYWIISFPFSIYKSKVTYILWLLYINEPMMIDGQGTLYKMDGYFLVIVLSSNG